MQLTQAVWLFCPAFILHVLEEWPRYTRWAQQHASERLTQRDYNIIHTAGIAASALSAGIVWLFPHPAVVFRFFAIVLTPAVFFNTLFHVGASCLTRTYCPGLFTALSLYIPLFALLTTLAHKEGFLNIQRFLAVHGITTISGFIVGHGEFQDIAGRDLRDDQNNGATG